jgi:hypothetical protein
MIWILFLKEIHIRADISYLHTESNLFGRKR